MREGTKVKVIACTSYHKFEVGEIVVYEGDWDGCTNFYSEKVGSWCMDKSEYVVL
jgi:hypothetical protein